MLRLPQDVAKQVRELAQRDGLSFNSLVIAVLNAYAATRRDTAACPERAAAGTAKGDDTSVKFVSLPSSEAPVGKSESTGRAAVSVVLGAPGRYELSLEMTPRQTRPSGPRGRARGRGGPS